MVVVASLGRRLAEHQLEVEQGTGLGRRLIDFAEEQAHGRALGEVRLYTNAEFTENRALYAHMGYVETGTQRNGDGAYVHMAKAL